MSRRPFVIFGLFALVVAVLVPFLVFSGNGESEAGEREIPKNLEVGKQLFDTNCGVCHALYVAGTDGNFGPNLDLLLAPGGPPEGETAADTIKATEGRVLNAIEQGVNGEVTPGRMPAGILVGEQAQQVSEFVAEVAGRG